MTQTTISSPVKGDIKDEIVALMQELPDDSLLMLREFGRFLWFQVQQQATTPLPMRTERPASLTFAQNGYASWIAVSPEEVLELTNILAVGYKGDAFEDTEAIYDEV
jgi:hypothetical protein